MIAGRINGYSHGGHWPQRTWTLTVHREAGYGDLGGYLPFARTWYQVDGLIVTPAQAQQICARELGAPVRVSVHYGRGIGEVMLRLDGVEVSAAEADLITRGMPPVTALAPRLVIRSLTEAELMA